MERISNKQYREMNGISRSDLNILRTKSPMHMQYAISHRSETETLALLEGRAAHKLILEPETFADEFVVMPNVDRRTKEGKAIYAEFIENSNGRDVLSIDSMEKIKDMAEAIKNNKTACEFLKGEHEVSFFWTDADTGERCKVRPDCLTEVNGKKYIVDYKTTDSCQDGHFERSVRKYGYKFQSGMYREGVFQNTFDDYGFVFVAQEKTAPYAVRVFICNDDFLQEGYEQFKQTINLYHWCKENDNWFGYEGPEDIVSELIGEGDIE